MSSISAGTSLGTALVSTGDTTGQLVLKTNGSTTAVTIGTDQVVTLAQPLPASSGGTGVTSFPAPGTSGNVLTSNGTAWASVTPTPGSGTNTFTASGSITAGKAVSLNSNGTVSAVSGALFAPSAVVNATGANLYAPLGSNYRATATNGTWVVGVYLEGDGTTVNYRATNLATGTVVNTSLGYSVNIDYRGTIGFYYDQYTQKFINFTLKSGSKTLYAQILTINNSTGDITTLASLDISGSVTTDYTAWVSNFGYASNESGQFIFNQYYFGTTSKYWYVVIDLNTNTSNTTVIGTGSGNSGGSVIWYKDQNKLSITYTQSSTVYNNVYTLSGTTLTLVKQNTGTIAGINVANLDASKAGYLTSFGKTVLGISGKNLYSVTLVSDTPVVTLETTINALQTTSNQAFAVDGKILGVISMANSGDTTTPVYYNEFAYSNGFISNGVVENIFTGAGDRTKAVTLLPNSVWMFISQTTDGGCYTYKTTATTSAAPLFIGISNQTVTNGQSCSVTTIGGLNSSVSGLTPGGYVYLTGDGAATQTATIAFCGTALSATTVLVRN